jgi:hypothetical protein
MIQSDTLQQEDNLIKVLFWGKGKNEMNGQRLRMLRTGQRCKAGVL